jgi:hypothetical protein
VLQRVLTTGRRSPGRSRRRGRTQHWAHAAHAVHVLHVVHAGLDVAGLPGGLLRRLDVCAWLMTTSRVRVARAVTGFTIELLTLAFRARSRRSCAPDLLVALLPRPWFGVGTAVSTPSGAVTTATAAVAATGALARCARWCGLVAAPAGRGFLPFGWLGDWAGTYRAFDGTERPSFSQPKNRFQPELARQRARHGSWLDNHGCPRAGRGFWLAYAWGAGLRSGNTPLITGSCFAIVPGCGACDQVECFDVSSRL